MSELTKGERTTEIRPPVDIEATEEGVRLLVEMPGARPDALSVSVENAILTILADREDGLQGMKIWHRETETGTYRRSFRLSRDLAREGIKAELRHGVLTVEVPRAEHTIPRRIEIEVGK
jgi:HSP20 family protein